MSQFKDATIKHVINEINVSYFIPSIQRNYVWLSDAKQEKIEKLFDSLLRGYPISTFLIWKLNKADIEFKKTTRQSNEKINIQLYKFLQDYHEKRGANLEKINAEHLRRDELNIVLDGQQRLTSLYIGLKGTRALRKRGGHADNDAAYEEKRLYINLRHTPTDEDPEDRYKFYFLSDEAAAKVDETQFWFKVGDILAMNYDDLEKYKDDHALSIPEKRIIGKLRDVFCVEEKISYFEERDKDLAKVLNIFTRVNSGGTQLSYSDLLMSILTASFSSDLKGEMESFVGVLKEKGFGIMERDHVLKTCLLLSGVNHTFKLENFQKKNICKIEENWEEIRKNILNAIEFLSDYGYEDQLSSGYIITAVAYFYFKYGKVERDDEKEVLRFVRIAQIKRYFSGQTDAKLTAVRDVINTKRTFADINKQLRSHPKNQLHITEEEVEGLADCTYGHRTTFSVLQILYPNLNYKTAKFHIDHIFPKSKFDRKKNTALDTEFIGRENELFNLQLLEGIENQEKKNKDPEEWLRDVKGTDEAIKKYKDDNFIKCDLPLTWENIKEFERLRREALVDKLKRYFGY